MQLQLIPITASFLIAASLIAASTPATLDSSVMTREGSKAARALAHEAYKEKFPQIKKRCSKKKASSGSSSSNSSTGSTSGKGNNTYLESQGKGNNGSSSSGSSNSDSSSDSSSSDSNSSSDSDSSSSGSKGNSGSKGSGSKGNSGSGNSNSDSGSDSDSGSGSSSGGKSGSGGNSNSGGGGDMNSKSNGCGSSNASSKDPNGSKSWLNCGLDSGGWQPAFVKLQDLNIISDNDAANSSTFAPCQKYSKQFKSAAQKSGIPVAILMAIALQESSCNAGAMGSRGEHGLMQITDDKCESGVDCSDPEYNIGKGASYLKNTINDFGGNFIEALGQYNGWTKGMRGSGSCGPQGQNLNYLNGMLNGFAQGKDGNDINGAC